MSDERTTEELVIAAAGIGKEGWERLLAAKELARRANEGAVYERAWHIIFRASGHDRCCEEALVEARKELGL